MQANPDSTFAGFANEGINFGGPLAALQNLAIAPQVQDPVAADLDQAQLLENEQKVFGNTQTILCNLNPLAYCTLVMLFAGEQAQDQVTDEANNQEFLNNVAANIRQEMDNARSYLATNAKNMGSGFVTSMNADGTTIPIYTGSTTTKYGDYGPSSTITDPNALNTYIQNLGDTLNSVTGMSSTNQIYLQSGASNVSQAFGMASSILKTMDSIYESIINHFPS